MNDPTTHIPLIYRVIGQMGLTASEADEAFSIGLLAITEGSLSYDPERQVPLANWLALNIRTSIYNWRKKQRRTITSGLYHLWPHKDEQEISLSEVVRIAERILTEQEKIVLFGIAAGFKGYEIAEKLHVSQKRVSIVKKRAQEKLKARLGRDDQKK